MRSFRKKRQFTFFADRKNKIIRGRIGQPLSLAHVYKMPAGTWTLLALNAVLHFSAPRKYLTNQTVRKQALDLRFIGQTFVMNGGTRNSFHAVAYRDEMPLTSV